MSDEVVEVVDHSASHGTKHDEERDWLPAGPVSPIEDGRKSGPERVRQRERF